MSALKAPLRAGRYRMRNGREAEVWGRSVEGNTLWPFFGVLPDSPDDDAWNVSGLNWAKADFDLVQRLGPLPAKEPT